MLIIGFINFLYVIGSAWSGTMCERMFSNSIVEVNSLLSGITVAHEIGHRFARYTGDMMVVYIVNLFIDFQ